MSYSNQADSIVQAISRGEVLPYITVEKQGRWVSEGLKEELALWDYNRSADLPPILINAPTGSGKSTFVMRDLAEKAKQCGKYILLLSNRTTLALQQKHNLNQHSRGAPFGSMVLHGLNQFDNVLVYTYHSVEQFFSDQNLVRTHPIAAVVFDEVHFFSSDATFNPYTARIFTSVLAQCRGCHRIYMSATPEDVRWLIAYEEQRLKNALRSSSNSVNFLVSALHPVSAITEYVFPADYSYINLHFMSDWDDTVARINASLDETDDKWLIFTSSSDKGKEIKKQIGDQAEFVNAPKKERSSTVFDQFARTERFNKRVLVTTSVLDNGVNFRDPQLKHVVIDSVDPIQTRQMLGRKRVEESETVHVYILQKTVKDIKKICDSLENDYKMLQHYRENPRYFLSTNWGNLSADQQQMFSSPTHNFSPSSYAPFQLACMLSRLEDIKDHMMRDGEDAFADEVCGWFGATLVREDVSVEPSLRDKAGENVEAIFDRFAELSPMSEEDLAELENKLKATVQPLGVQGPTVREGKSRSVANLNRVAEYFHLPFHCKKQNNQYHLSRTGSAAEQE